MFVGKARSLPQSGASQRCFTWVGYYLACKYYLEKLAKEKHSSLLRKFVTYVRKNCCNIGPRTQLSSSGYSVGASTRARRPWRSTTTECWRPKKTSSSCRCSIGSPPSGSPSSTPRTCPETQACSTRCRRYNTFYGRESRIFVISQTICPWQTFPVQSNVGGAYLRAVPFRCSTLGQAPLLTCKLKTRLEKLARDKRYSLLREFVTYGRKKFYNIGPRCRRYKNIFYFVIG